jgi:uncharacterized LabA/DUF88 family protein
MNGSHQRAALLIDADNLSPEGMATALRHLREQNLDVCVLRAYGSHETLAAIKDFLQVNAVRSVVNQGKGTTDAALVVDAMDLLHAGALPPLVALGSGDADFAPLVLRLREAGRRMVCYAQRQKAAEGLDRFYADVVYVDAAKAKAPARKSTKASSPPPAPAPAETLADQVWDVLETFAGFREGQDIELNAVVQKLREMKLMGRSTGARNFFEQHAPEVELRPERNPSKLRWPE